MKKKELTKKYNKNQIAQLYLDSESHISDLENKIKELKLNNNSLLNEMLEALQSLENDNSSIPKEILMILVLILFAVLIKQSTELK